LAQRQPREVEPQPLELPWAEPHRLGGLRAEPLVAGVAQAERDPALVEPVLGVEPDLEGHRLALAEAVAHRAVAGHCPYLVHAARPAGSSVAAVGAVVRRADEAAMVGT